MPKKSLFIVVALFLATVAIAVLLLTNEFDTSSALHEANEKTQQADNSQVQVETETAPDTAKVKSADLLENSTQLRQAVAADDQSMVQGKVVSPDPLETELLVYAEYKLDEKEEKTPTTPVNKDGSFSLGIAPQINKIKLIAEGNFQYGALSLEKAENAAWSQATVVVTTGGVVEGKVFLPNGEAAANCAVILALAGDPMGFSTRGIGEGQLRRKSQTNAEGWYKFRGVSMSKERILSAYAKNYAVGITKSIRVQKLQTTRVDVHLQLEASLAGKVESHKGEPMEAVEIDLLPWEGLGALVEEALVRHESVGEAKTDAQGEFLLSSLAAGRYKIRARKKGWGMNMETPVQLRAGEQKKNVLIQLHLGESISGKVLAPDGNALAEATVSAKYRPNPNTPSQPNFGFDAISEKTDAAGKFTITGLGKDPINLVAEKENVGKGVLENVTPGTLNIELRIAPFAKLTGSVRDAKSNNPLTKFKISLIKSNGPWIKQEVHSDSFANEDGRYSLSQITPGNFTIVALSDNHVAARQDLDMSAGGEFNDINFAMEPAATIRGTILSHITHTPVMGAQVIQSEQSNPWQWMQNLADPTAIRAASDYQGVFELKGLLPGEIHLRVNHNEYATKTAGPFKVEAGNVLEDVEILLADGGGLEGFVYNDEGFVVPGAMVQLIGMTSGDMRFTNTNDQGYFVAEKGLTPGKYQVIAIPNMGDGSDSSDIMAGMMKNMKVKFADVEEGKINRVILGEKKSDGVTVVGRVLAGDQPVSGAYISIVPKKDSNAENASLNFTAADGEGNFRLTNVTPGATAFTVQRPDGMGSSININADIPAQDEFSINLSLPGGSIAGTVVDTKTGSPVRAIGLSLREETNNQLGLQILASYGQAQTDENGHYIFRDIGAGSYVITAGGGWFTTDKTLQYGRKTQIVAVQGGEAITGIHFSLNPAGMIKGNVHSAGKPVDNASIFVQNASGQAVETFSLITTNSTGSFQYPGLASGNYSVIARADGYAPAIVEGVLVEEGNETPVTLQLIKGTKVIVKVTDSLGQVLADASVQAFDPAGKPLASLASLSEILAVWSEGLEPGSYSLGTIRPGKYRVVLKREGYQTKDVTLVVLAQDSQAFELGLEALE